MNIHCNGHQSICEAIITITFPCKQTIMKHDMNKFNLTQFECRIQNLISLLVNRKKLNAMCFYCFCRSKYYKSISPPLNLLSPKSNQHLISPYNMTSESYIKVNKRNDHQLKKLLIVVQILLVSTIGNVWRTVWRICIMMLGCKRLTVNFLMMCTFSYGHLILVSIFYQLIYKKNQGHKGNLINTLQANPTTD